MGLDINAVAAMAAKAKGATAKSVGDLPDNVEDYIAQLVDDEVLDIGQATALRLLIGKAKVEAVAESIKRATGGAFGPEVAATDETVDSTADVIEDQAPDVLLAEATAFDAEIERRRAQAQPGPQGPTPDEPGSGEWG